jgi:hypothetical protein
MLDSNVPSSIPRFVPAEARWPLPPAAIGYDPVRQSVRCERRARRRPAGVPQVRHRCRTTRGGFTAMSESAGYYPNGYQVGYDAQAKSGARQCPRGTGSTLSRISS